MSRRSRSQVFALRQLDLDLTKHEFAGLVLLGRIQNRRLAFLFVTLQERIDEKVNITRHLCLLLRYGSRFIVKYTKAAKSEVKPQINLVIVPAKRCTPCQIYHIYFASQPISCQTVLNWCGFAVYKTNETVYRFENAPLLKAFLKRPGSDNELDRRRVNERCNRIETDAVTNEPASV